MNVLNSFSIMQSYVNISQKKRSPPKRASFFEKAGL
jgi:hypothetical protein